MLEFYFQRDAHPLKNVGTPLSIISATYKITLTKSHSRDALSSKGIQYSERSHYKGMPVEKHSKNQDFRVREESRLQSEILSLRK